MRNAKQPRLRRKDRKFDIDAENAKDILAYAGVKAYAVTDIPIPTARRASARAMPAPRDIWRDYARCATGFEAERISDADGVETFRLCVERTRFGPICATFEAHSASFESKKAVFLVADDAPDRARIVESILSEGIRVFLLDRRGPGASVPPELLDLGPDRAESVPAYARTPELANTLIFRRGLEFAAATFPETEIIALGIRDGAEIAMRVAGLEPSLAMGVACVCGAGCVDFADGLSLSDDDAPFDPSDETLAEIIRSSGASYMKNYPNPVFVGLGSNGTRSDFVKLPALAELLSNRLTISVSRGFADSIDEKGWATCLAWLNATFWRGEFPAPPATRVEIGEDGAAYAIVVASTMPAPRRVELLCARDGRDPGTRQWLCAPCESTGESAYVARLTFDRPCSRIFCCAVAHYKNGLASTALPIRASLDPRRLAVDAPKPGSILFEQRRVGELVPIGRDAIIPDSAIREARSPSGTPGALFERGSMRLFLGDAAKNVPSDKLLQIDARAERPTRLGIALRAGTEDYVAERDMRAEPEFSSLHFRLADFKSRTFRPLPSWQNVSTLTVVPENIAINKMLFV